MACEPRAATQDEGDEATSCTDQDARDRDPLGDELHRCDTFRAEEPSPKALAVTIVNATEHAVVIANTTQGCHAPARFFTLSGTAGGRAVSTAQQICPDEWPSCDVALDGIEGCRLCETLHHDRLIASGGELTLTWDALVLVHATLPDSCVAEGGGVECQVPMTIPPGDYELRVEAASTSACPVELCELDALGSCSLETFAGCAPTLHATAAWDGTCAVPRLRIVE